jgi:uncharacterized protein
MSHTPHTLDEEFPDMRERIDALKTTNNHFARLADEYHEINRQVHRIETRVEPASEEIEQELKRRRMRLKDEIAGMLAGNMKTGAGPGRVADPDGSDLPRVSGGAEA